MSYHRVKKTTPIVNIVLALAIAVLVIVLLLFTPLFSFLSKGLGRAGLGFYQAGQEISNEATAINAMTTSSKKGLIEENQHLREQLDLYKGKLLSFRSVQNENKELRELLAVIDEQEHFMTTRILSKPSQSAYNTMTIKGGAENGMEIGDVITAFGTVVLGEVIEVYKKTSKVRLYSSPGVITKTVVTSEGLFINAEGNGSGNFALQLPRDLEIETGTQILDVRTNMLLGSVQASLFDPREPFQTILVRSPINVQHLWWVEVMK